MRDLSRFYNPERFEEIRLRHQRALAWQPQGRIPLGIHVVNPDWLEGLKYSEWLNPEVYCKLQARFLEDSLAVGSDVLPVVGMNHLGEAPLTSLFGAEQFMPEQVSRTSNPWDIGPTPLPVFSSIENVANLEPPSLDCGLMPRIEEMGMFYRDHLPDWVSLIGPMPSGPFSAAMELRGTDFLYDLVDAPALCSKLIGLCAETQVRLEQQFRRIVATPLDLPYSNFGVLGAGLRLGEDSICSISRAMIHSFCAPTYHRVNELFGGRGHIHFCSLPHSRFEHIYPALAKEQEVDVVSSQFGFEYYAAHLDELRGRLAVESFYGEACSYVCREYGSFPAWAQDFVPRFKNESGLLLYTQVSSIDEGRAMWQVWEDAHIL